MRAPTIWRTNPSSEANEYPYDSAEYVYDSSDQNYDGVVGSDMSDREILPVSWEKVDKSPTSWLSDTSDLYMFDSLGTYDSEDQSYDGSVDTNRKTPTRWRNS
jgi:hypothetical protein